MNKLLLVLVLVVAGFCIYWFFIRVKKTEQHEEAQTTQIKAGNHSETFQKGIDSLLGAYLDAKAAFVDADTARAKTATRLLVTLADSSKLSELKSDTSGIFESVRMLMNDVKLNAESLIQQHNVTEMRQDFRMIGESIYPLLKTIHYEGQTLYLQHCPMAFGEDKGANWISSTREIINPYLGKNHPEFKGSMLHCGELKDSIKAQ